MNYSTFMHGLRSPASRSTARYSRDGHQRSPAGVHRAVRHRQKAKVGGFIPLSPGCRLTRPCRGLFLIAPPKMAYYMEYSTAFYQIYLKYIAPEDMVVYSIDEIVHGRHRLSQHLPADGPGATMKDHSRRCWNPPASRQLPESGQTSFFAR